MAAQRKTSAKSPAPAKPKTPTAPKPAGKPKTIDDLLAGVTAEQRVALEQLRQTIRKAAPQAEECISYGLAAFRQQGMLVAFGASPKHCAFYTMSSTTVKKFGADLAKYDTSTGTIRFQPDQPLPAALVRKLVKARLAENAALTKKSKAKKSK